MVFLSGEKTEISEIVSFLVARVVKIEGVNKKEASLEEMYTSIVKASEDSL
jgi:hypothetical protein